VGGEDKPTVRNAWVEFTKDANGETQRIITAVPMRDVISLVQRANGNWPRQVAGSLFIHDHERGAVHWLTAAPALFGWMANNAGVIDWHRGRGCVTKEETFHELRRTAQGYKAVESLPHEPRIDGHYYACPDVPSGDGSSLRKLLDFFCPATTLDRDLIQAAIMTCFWGGPGGMRPAFVITTDDGPGSGKSTVAHLVGDLAGGIMAFDRGEEASQIKTRMLSADALTKRAALLDNVKSLKFSWGELEGLITADTVSGKVMYVGEGRRPNTITWFLTLNGANLSTDMAQRAVTVKVRRPDRSATWEESVRSFIAANRPAIIADVIAALRAEPYAFTSFTRWAMWERAVLARLPEPVDAQKLIAERQQVVDAEQEENEQIEEFFAEQLLKLEYEPAESRVFLPIATVAEWYCRATRERMTITAVSRLLRRMCAENRFLRLIENRCRSYGRGFLWIGDNAAGTNIRLDVADRISTQRYSGLEGEGGPSRQMSF
jgi:hypothetical protein